MERPAIELGSVGLILPPLPQQTTPTWATVSTGATARGAGGPQHDADDPINELSGICQRAEALGASALWACDHLFWHGPVLECMTALRSEEHTSELQSRQY